MIEKEHPRAGLLRAIANGKTIQIYRTNVFSNTSDWVDESHTELLYDLGAENFEEEWQIKPQVKSDMTRRMFVEMNPCLDNAYDTPNLELTFDGETHKLKAAKILEQ